MVKQKDEPVWRQTEISRLIFMRAIDFLREYFRAERNLNVNIIDLYDQQQNATGTQVDLFVPYDK